jgi:hypothetical protein
MRPCPLGDGHVYLHMVVGQGLGPTHPFPTFQKLYFIYFLTRAIYKCDNVAQWHCLMLKLGVG